MARRGRSKCRSASRDPARGHAPVARLAQRGFEAVHWSTIGAASALDNQILRWARERGWILLTNDLDCSAILASTSDRAPSVVQLRGQDLLSEVMVDAVARAVSTYREELAQGALLSIDEKGVRVRILPLGGSGSLPRTD